MHAPGWQVKGLTRRELDLTDFNAVRELFRKDRPGLVIHCAALSQSPVCQADPATARQMNVEVTRVLAELAAGIPLLFFSTDLVFDGAAGNYDETAPVSPLSVYAETKVEAERLVLANPRHTVLRTSINSGRSPAGDRSLNEQVYWSWEKGETLWFFTDEFRSPIDAQVTARATWELATRNEPGIYHVCGRKRLSRWEIGQLLAARRPDLNPKLVPTSRREYRGAPRPADPSLNCAKAQALLSFQLPGFDEWLASGEADW
jgi:dTDP-4-dehydrorhamnose reductase